ncbi:50S ribosomal protein L21 [candidate division WOR-1 bacterium DG_54_3]|uniref:Large ribosomal subunit protein bL21 n=1 Tax=candidate division WOR-1 bacterium DG_54_3 TaxID=1703775 RepID=A0A0S7Y3N8_UNCSA|nr:MAG: 50S ribosomal protein L21 [candidate division WOR-1 bacterium DG_54_3]
MYAIIETGGKQYKVSQGDVIEVELIEAKRHVTFDKVLLISEDGKPEIGTPYVKGAKVSAKVLDTGKDVKVTTFKFKHKTNYHRTIGHRQPFTRVEIEEVKHGA